MPAIRPVLTLAATVAAVLLLSACSGPTETASTPGESPLSPYLTAIYGGGVGDEKEQQARFDEQEKKRQSVIAQCMTEQGFEYTPDAPSSTIAFSTGEEWKPDEREWVAQYGYGITHRPGADEPAPENTYVDPNADYLATLSESERAAFSEALYGAAPSETELPSDEIPEYDWTKAGCSGRAEHEVSGEDPLQGEEFRPLMDALAALWSDTSRWPGMTTVDTEWAQCMDDAGYPGLQKQSDASASISDAYDAAWSQTDSSSAHEIDAEAASRLSKTEIDTALADFDCRAKTDYQARALKAQFSAEEAFIVDHKADLEAAKAAAAQARP